MILAQRILDILRDNGPIASAEFPKWFADVERMDLDAEVNRLLRKSAISFAFNKFDLVVQKPNGQHKTFIATPIDEPVGQLGCNRDAPPSAAEEAAASLKPAEETSYCLKCDSSKPVSQFQRSKHGNIWKTCKKCLGKTVIAGIAAKRLERSEGNPVLPVQSKLGSTASPNENHPSDSSSHTPAPPPQGSTEPPPVSSEHPSGPLAQGTLTASMSPRDPEALPAVGAGRPDVMLLQLAEKRRRWVTEIAALQHAIDSADRLVSALQALEET